MATSRLRRTTAFLATSLLIAIAGLGVVLLWPIGGTALASDVSPALSLDPTSASPAGSVTATASGFEGCTPVGDDVGTGSVTFRWDQEDVVGASVQISGGSASAAFLVPKGASISEHEVSVVCDGNSEISTLTHLKVVPPPDPLVPVPDIVGSSRKDAEAALDGAGLGTGVITGSGDQVKSQSPGAGTAVASQSLVDFVMGASPPVTVVVPNLVGLLVSKAAQRLDRSGLALGSRSAQGQIVTAQSPAAFTRAERGTRVDVTLGPVVLPRVVVPDLIGSKLEAVPGVLSARGLALGAVSGRGSTVRSQRPVPGTLVERETAVAVSVEAGVPAPRVVRTPNIVGDRPGHARRVLALVGLRLGYPDTGADRRVVRQAPRAGVLVPRGTTVTIAVAKPLPPRLTPTPTPRPTPRPTPTPNSRSALIVILTAGAMAMLGGAVAVQHLRSRRSEVWVHNHVRARHGGVSLTPPTVEPQQAPGKERDVVVHIEPHADSGTHFFEEVER